MKNKFKDIGTKWRRIRNSSRFHNVLMFIIFVAIAAVFWFIIALNDSVTETFNVKLVIRNVPDSVTFITEPPTEFHVTLRDKGSNILRSGVIKDPAVVIDFGEYARDGIFRLSSSDLMGEVKTNLGGVAQITSISLDSLRYYYTNSPGKRVPVVIRSDLTAASGYVIQGAPEPVQKSVLVYSYGDEADTVRNVYTNILSKKELSQSSVFKVKLKQIPGVRIIPDNVEVDVFVQPLVNKEAYVEVDALNVPPGESLILFPNRVPVSFFVPMDKFNDENPDIHVVVDYNDVNRSATPMIPVRISAASPSLVNVVLKADSVEYSIVKK